jgi:type 1 glutamine amidotransferase
MNRRAFIVAVAAGTIAAAAAGVASRGVGSRVSGGARGHGPDEENIKVLLIWTPPDHPYGTHMYERGCRLLAKCLNQTPGVEAVVSPGPGWPTDQDQFRGVKSLVLYTCNAGDIVLSPDHRQQFAELLKSGVGYCAVHWSTKANDPKLVDEYVRILGGSFYDGGDAGLKIDTLPLQPIDASSPVCRGWKPYDIHDEFYLNCKFDPKATPILKVSVEGKDQVVAWSIERSDTGRSFGTTLGHFFDNFEREEFRKLIVNGVLWSAKVEVPESGAPVAAGEEDLKLPPDPKAGK